MFDNINGSCKLSEFRVSHIRNRNRIEFYYDVFELDKQKFIKLVVPGMF